MTGGTKWSASRRVESPAELADLFKDVSDAVHSGELHQIVPTGAPFATTEDIRKIPPTGPWPDYLEFHLHDAQSGKHYKLVVETYHGHGGTWESVP